MKLFIVLMMFFCVPFGYGQGFFPLHEGNLWQMEDADPMVFGILESEVTGTAEMANGITYAVISGGLASGLFRQEDNIVYAYNPADTTEYQVFNFLANVGDTISIREDPYRSIVLLERDTVFAFGTSRVQWIFGEEGPAWFATRTILDSIGLSYIFMEPGVYYYPRGAVINGIQYGTITSIESPENEPPISPNLHQNYPNPFNPSTTISFTLPGSRDVSLKIFNLLGEEVATLVIGHRDAGTHTVQWNASGQPSGYTSGVYFYRLEAGSYTETKKLVLLR